MKILLKIGGSVLFRDNDFNVDLIDYWTKIVISLLKKNYKIGTVIGGGLIARKYIHVSRRLGLSEFISDTLGILVSRINASLFLYKVLRESSSKKRIYPRIVDSAKLAFEIINYYDAFFSGGLFPGQSTMGVAAELAEAIEANYLLVATNVDGIYNRDPKKFPNARKIDFININNLIQMFSSNENLAGTYSLFDQQALMIIKRSKIPTIIFNGLNYSLVEKILMCLDKNDLNCFARYGSVITFQ